MAADTGFNSCFYDRPYLLRPFIPRLLAQTPPTTPTTELRGVWLTNIDSDVIFSRNNIIDAVNRLDKLNFNTIYPTVWQGGYTLYPSAAAQGVFGQSIDPSPELKGRDILKEIIAQSRQKGIAVIPWFEFGFMAPAESELATLHPDWLAQRRDGSTIWKEGEHERVWLNPFHPEVQQFILDLILEIVDNYDIDGIQFDDHFGLPVEFGYDPLTVLMYQEQIKSPPSDDSRETFWVRWRADKINDFMGQFPAPSNPAKKNVLSAYLRTLFTLLYPPTCRTGLPGKDAAISKKLCCRFIAAISSVLVPNWNGKKSN